jgi:hypothetical protein
MNENSIPIRFDVLKDIQLQLLFEEHILDGFEEQAIKYCEWLLKLSEEKRKAHHNSLSHIAHVVRVAHGRIIDITPDCDCPMCAQWYFAAIQELSEQARVEKVRRKLKKNEPKTPKPTFIYLVLDERTGYIKIGQSKNPSARERTLQSEKPHVTMIFSNLGDAELEQELHQEYARFRIRGEWFKLTEDQVESIKIRIMGSDQTFVKASLKI